MDVRLYIVAATFALMVVSLITVVVIAARARRRREKPINLEEHPSMPPVSMDAMAPVDTDLRGLEVPVPENSPHAALLKPLAERPVWEEAAPTRRAPNPPRYEPAPLPDSAALAAESHSVAEPDAMAAEPPAPEEAADAVPAPTPVVAPAPGNEFPEGTGRIPQIGRREVHRLPSADEILASLEAEMARQEADEQLLARAPGLRDEPSTTEEVHGDSPAAPRTPAVSMEVESGSTIVARTASGAGVPAEQVQWRPVAPVPVSARAAELAAGSAHEPAVAEVSPHEAPSSESVREAKLIEEPPSAPSSPVERTPVPERPAAVVRAAEPPAPAPKPDPAPVPAEPRPAVRVAGIRVPLKTGEESASDASAQVDAENEAGDVPDIELSSPVEMWFGDHRVGVKQGTPTFDRLQRYADAMLNDLRGSRDDSDS